MFRFLLILSLIVYAIYKIGSLFFRAGAASQQLRNQQQRNFDNNVGADPRATKAKGGKKGGEYIDYEEVK
ncbi:MAG TPA: hypothetical protein VK589_23780 [Chryseolinea sp.]|nr:hypothetical protein [Chryseolinea sp.]